MQFKWLTDPHLDLLLDTTCLGVEWASDLPLLISGDISDANHVVEHLKTLKKGYRGPIYFVLGNHDYYHSSWAAVDKKLANLRTKGLINLDAAEVVPLGDYALVGQTGWYGGVGGETSTMRLRDFYVIRELQGAPWGTVLERIRERALYQALKLQGKIEAAIEYGHQKIVVLTHVPPFVNAGWHLGRRSEPDALSWFTSPVTGERILRLADQYDVKILVLCGHTHSKGECHASERVRCLTGKALYYLPELVGTFDLDVMFEAIEVGEPITRFPQSRGPGC